MAERFMSHSKKWQQKDIDLLKTLMSNNTAMVQIAIKLGRTESSIRSMVNKVKSNQK